MKENKYFRDLLQVKEFKTSCVHRVEKFFFNLLVSIILILYLRENDAGVILRNNNSDPHEKCQIITLTE